MGVFFSTGDLIFPLFNSFFFLFGFMFMFILGAFGRLGSFSFLDDDDDVSCS